MKLMSDPVRSDPMADTGEKRPDDDPSNYQQPLFAEDQPTAAELSEDRSYPRLTDSSLFLLGILRLQDLPGSSWVEYLQTNLDLTPRSFDSISVQTRQLTSPHHC